MSQSRRHTNSRGRCLIFLYRIKLFSLFGFQVSVDASWLLLAALVTWTLAGAVFPHLAPRLSAASYWAMGALATVGLLLSIVFHETAHSLVARHYGMPIRGITLFIFGGVAEMTAEPGRPRDELLMAAAGPAASLLLATILFLLFNGVVASGGPTSVAGVLWYLRATQLHIGGLQPRSSLSARRRPDLPCRPVVLARRSGLGDAHCGRCRKCVRHRADRVRPDRRVARRLHWRNVALSDRHVSPRCSFGKL